MGSSAAVLSMALPTVIIEAPEARLDRVARIMELLAEMPPDDKREMARRFRNAGFPQPSGIIADLIDTWADRQERGVS